MLNWKQYKHVCDNWRVKDAWGTTLDAGQMWADLMVQFGAYPDGKGNMLFETEAGELFFILKYAQQHDNAD